MESEDGAVLKLVHPGRFVEIHRKALTAGEVMARNPRHFVTRPDVFRFPWVVVRPESLLCPGNVFYIVPCHTLYRLVQTSRRGDRNESPRLSDRRLHPNDGAVTYSDFDGQSFVVDGGAGGLREQQACELKPCLKKGNSNASSSSASTRRGGGCRLVFPFCPASFAISADGITPRFIPFTTPPSISVATSTSPPSPSTCSSTEATELLEDGFGGQ
ncbi:hypothetical protein ZIOFF_031134 [Zingiber officinale]|uniref:Uncharacterized protein n=1 Tax=Zingiber officinale TaxID=94328 RepID=A0A8J5GRW8_ZINOF|nr:hypothetical protein ZIOFF_031134 [Zingiber officinale]